MTPQTLEQRFKDLNAARPVELVEKAWQRIALAYQESQRHYHTLVHLSQLFRQFDQLSPGLKNAPVVAMAIFYHDIVYQPGSGENEDKSAEIATRELQQLGWKERDVREVAAYIRSTKTHQADTAVLNPGDLALFLDMDLSILGADWDSYRSYAEQILKEFRVNAMIKLGRRGFMQRFLEREHIYQTPYFRNKLEQAARRNIEREIRELLQ